MSIRSVVASVRDCLFVIALSAGSAAYAADFTPLGSLPDRNSFWSYPHAVSSDGKTIVGDSVVSGLGGGEYRAVQWRDGAGPTSLGTIPGAYNISARAVSATGEGIIGFTELYGYAGFSSFYWSATTGLIVPTVLPGYSNSTAMAISADGSTMVGAVYGLGDPWSPNRNSEAVRWSRTQSYFVGLGYLGGSNTYSSANAVSADGAVIVGSSSSPNAEYEAFRWTEATGMVGLGFLPGGRGSEASFVSGDGRVVVGWANFYDTSRQAAFRWTEETGMTDLGGLPGAVVTVPFAMSRDGRFVVGQSGDWSLGTEAFRWSESGGIVSLGGLPGAQMSFAIAVSDDGAVVLGQSYYSDGHSEPFVWTEALGVRSLRDVIAASNRDISGWQDLRASALSNDGNTIVGQGYIPTLNRQEGWVIRLDGNSLPTAVIGYSPQDPYKRNPISFWGTDSTDPDGDPLTYRWDFGDGTTAVGPIVSHTYAEAGNYQVTLVVNDGKDSTQAMAMVAVFNHTPIANAGGPYSGEKNTPIRFDGTASTDADNDPLVLYIWDFGDDTFANGATPAHTYAKSGTYTVTLFVYDNNNYSLPAHVQVTVTNTAPIARLSGPAAGLKSSVLTWDGSDSSDANGDPLSYHWNFGDGSSLTTSTPTATHSYATLGSYRVTLTVNDGETNSSPASVDVSIQNRPPVANAGGPYSGVKNAAIRFDGTASTDSDGDPLTYTWNFGDGTTGSGTNPMHTYAAGGTYTVTLTVNDGITNSIPAGAQVTVNNTAPIARVSGPATGFKSSVLMWDGSGSSDANGDTLTYHWDFGDGSSLISSTPTVTHSYTTIGSYLVTLVVSDGEMSSSPATADVSIQNQPPIANAGSDRTVTQRTTVKLNGSGSTDPDGRIVSVRWRQVAGPTVTLSGSTTLSPSFVAPRVSTTTKLTFELTVTDNDGVSSSDRVDVNVTRR